jgi:cytochrome c peroxidase
MKRLSRLFGIINRSRNWVGVLALLCVMPTIAQQDDRLLGKVVQAYQLRPLDARAVALGAKERLGRALFFDPIVSGPRSISCATCHVRSKGAGDGLDSAVGLGSRGIGEERLASKDAFLVPRNSLPFFNRGRPEFSVLFWDGRVQLGPKGEFQTPLGEKLPEGFDSLLAAASVFPLAEPDEMLGRSEERGRNPSQYHRELLSDTGVADNNFQERTLVVFRNLPKRLLGERESSATTAQAQYRQLFSQAYPGVPLTKLSISHVGNGLAAYIDAAFNLKPAPWDRYLAGDFSALTSKQKQGALVFFGRGRCAVCHTGQEFSDFGFHGLAVPQLSVAKHGAFVDYGRANATSRGVDRYKFRTPPLRNVIKTGPWGHNGVFKSIREVIEHHFNPVPTLYKAQQTHPESARYSGAMLAQRSRLLGEISPLTPSDLDSLEQFLSALSSPTSMDDQLALPKSVPSGDSTFVRP